VAQSKVKNPGPEDQALAIPRGDLFCMKKMNPGRLWRRRRRVNIECGYRSCPPSGDILNALRSFVACPPSASPSGEAGGSLISLIKLKRRRRTLIRRWKFDVRRSFFKHKTPGQSHLSMTWPKGRGFSEHNKNI